MGKTDFLEQRFLDHIFNDAAHTTTLRPSTLFIGLFETIPTADDGTGGTEITAGGYARVEVIRDGAANTFDDAAAVGTMASRINVVFPTASADWPQIVGAGIWNGSTGGADMLYFQALTGAGVTVNNGDTPRFNAGQIVITDD